MKNCLYEKPSEIILDQKNSTAGKIVLYVFCGLIGWCGDLIAKEAGK